MVVQEIVRLLVAAGLGGLIGLERERLDRAAGLRTHALVATAAALVMLVSSYGFNDVVTANRTVVLDPSRVAAQVVSGIGFLGAGTIILRRSVVRGLTTAASLWAVAGIGLAVGGGLYVPAVATTAIALVILSGLKPLERRLFARKRIPALLLHVRREPGQVGAIEATVRECGLALQLLQLEPGRRIEDGTVKLEVEGGSAAAFSRLVERLQEVRGVKKISYGDRVTRAQFLEPGEADDDWA
jgi:putative Mg2+ transporter-C (MgtC) family protein